MRVLVAVLLVAAVVAGAGALLALALADDLPRALAAAGRAAPAVLLGILVLRPFTLVPLSLVRLAAGLLLGPLLAIPLLLVGATAGAGLAFAAGRLLGAERLAPRLAAEAPRVAALLAERTFATVASLRIAPVLPHDVVSFGAGASRARAAPFLAGTFLGMLPWTVAWALAGSAIGWWILG